MQRRYLGTTRHDWAVILGGQAVILGSILLGVAPIGPRFDQLHFGAWVLAAAVAGVIAGQLADRY